MVKINNSLTHKKEKYVSPYKSTPKRKVHRVWDDDLGTPEEEEKCALAFENIVLKILNYADKKEVLTEEEEKEIRRFYTYFVGGIKKRHLRYKNRDVPLTSADVLYILARSNKDSYRVLGERFGVSYELIREIVTGKNQMFKFEYELIRRIESIVRNKIKDHSMNIPFYLLFETDKCSKGEHKDLLCISKSKRYLEELRFKIICKRNSEQYYQNILESNTLNILFPIEKSEITKDYFYQYQK